ncbi:MAG: recombinase family protein [Dehalococcoidia bacterium]
MRAVGYFRIPDGDGEALAERNRSFADFCQQHGYEVAATFLDVGGGNGELPGYHQLLEYLRRPDHGFVMVVISSLRDLGQGPREVMRSYFELECLGAKVISLDGTADVGLAVLEAWPQLRGSSDASERVRAAMRRKAIKGEVLGRAPFGYCAGPRRRLVVVPEEAAVVRYIFRLYLRDGLGIRLIARRLNEERFRTRQGGLWSMVGVRDILRNRVYLGTYNRLGVRVPANHQAIISHDDFRRVQERLNSRRPSSNGRQTATFLLSGLAYCGACGNKMTGISRRQRWRRRNDGDQRTALYRYYQCQSRTNQSVCDYHTRRADDLEEAVRQALLGQGGTVVQAIPQAGDVEAVLNEAQERCRRLQSRLRRLDRRLEGYAEATALGRITYERLRSLGSAIASQRLSLQESLAEAQRHVQQQATAARRQQHRAEALAQLAQQWEYMGPPQQQALFQELVDRVIVSDDGIQLLLRP